MNTPLVSVILCTYNGSLYIEEQLQTILNQTYQNLEVIISDDASADNTLTLLQPYTSDKRVHLYRNENNLGYNLNFSKACSKAQGVYIAIADQDDIWELDKIALLVNAIEADEKIILVHSVSARFEDRENPHLKSLKVRNHFQGNDIRGFFMTNPIPGHNMLFRKTLLEKALPFPARVHYDRWLAAYACVLGNIAVVDRILVWHRIHSSNATGAAKPKFPFFEQQRAALQEITQIKELDPAHRAFGEQLLQGYSQLANTSFSPSLFWLLLRYAKALFPYKKRLFPWPSYSKHAFRYALRKTLA